MLPSYYLGKNDSGIHMYQFTDVVAVLDLNKKFGGSTDLVKKKACFCGFAYPYSPLFGGLSVFMGCVFRRVETVV